MKTCPSCRRSYKDDTLVFCLDDGTRLTTSKEDANATWHLPQPPASSDAPPVRTTIPSPPATITARPDQFQYRPRVEDEPSGRRRNPLPWILAIVFVIGLSAIAITYIVMRGDSTGIVVKNPSPDPTPKPTTKPEPTTEKPAFEVLDNISFNGTRITYYPRPSFEQCESDCAKMENCKGFTWIRPGAYNPGDSAMCYLMSAVTDRVSHSCCISAVRN